MFNPYKKDFPIFSSKDNKDLIYLDSAATSQKPSSVLDRMNHYYMSENANPHRGLYDLSVRATDAYEEARLKVSKFIHAESKDEIIFTRNATEALNLIAYTYGRAFIKPGDEILISILEHHSNILPWQRLAKETGAVLKYLYLDENYRITDEEINEKITDKTKIVSINHVSNVLGTMNPVEKIIALAHEKEAIVILDAAQSIPHMEIDVTKLDVDFLVFSGHKMLAPMGIGVLYGKMNLLNSSPPFLSGGEMIEYVTEQEASYAPVPQKFEAGTPNVGGAIGLLEAINYIEDIGYDEIHRIDEELTNYALKEMAKLSHITIYGNTSDKRYGVISFNVNDVHPHDTASILDSAGVAIRAGHHCAQPLMRYLNLNATCRVSFYIYNTKEDIDKFINSLKNVRGYLGLED